MRAARLFLVVSLGVSLAACSSDTLEPAGEPTGVAEDEANSFKAPPETSCEAKGMRKVANEATLDELDDAAKLDRRAAENIVKGRPYETLKQLDAIALVGPSALNAILAYAKAKGHVASVCAPALIGEIGIVSDLDKTVIPESEPDLAKAPYPGVKALFTTLETKNGGKAGDVYYVTARKPERVTLVPDYLTKHGVPLGPIETGVSGVPWVAHPEKVRDVASIFARTGTQKFVLFGDTSQRDPEVYKDVIKAHPGRVIAGFIHKVNAEVPKERLTGLVLHESYAEVAAVLVALDVLTRDEAKGIMRSARDEGLAIDDAGMEKLLDEKGKK